MEHRFFRVGETLHQTFTIRKDGQAASVRVGDKETEASIEPLGEHSFLLRLPTRQVMVDWARRDRDIFLQIDGESFRLREEDAAHSMADADHGEAAEPMVNAPLPGKVVKLLVKPGDQVRKGQAMIIIDSMKVEFELKAPREGAVEKVLAAEGQQLEVGQNLILFKG